jgi:hypothetical protein
LNAKTRHLHKEAFFRFRLRTYQELRMYGVYDWPGFAMFKVMAGLRWTKSRRWRSYEP